MNSYRYRWIGPLALLVCLALAVALPALAQGELSLSLRKVVGTKLGNRIQGQMQLSASGPQDLKSVTFELDGQPMATVAEPPFTLRFNTDRYTPGLHTLSATGETAGGSTVKSAPITVEIISAAAAMRLIAPIVIGVLAIAALGAVVPALLDRRSKRRFEPGAARDYGPAGGAICPRCGRPFARNVLGLNLLTGKLDHCPYCGKWAILRRASREELAKAEAAEIAGARPAVSTPSAEEKLRRQIEESKYRDG